MNGIGEKIYSWFLKFVIFADIDAKAIIYLPLTMLLSLTTQLYPLPDSYFNYKDNILNRGFMTLHYVWNVIALIPFAIIISYAYSKGKFVDVLFNTARTSIAIVACQVIGEVFFRAERFYDHCSKSASLLKTEQECISQGYEWIKFSLSGHTLFLFYYSLITMEEMRLYKIWQSLADAIFKVDHHEIPFADIPIFRNYTEEEFLKVKNTFTFFGGFVKLWIVCIGVYILMLDFSTVTTLIYFHELNEKLYGGILAIAFWYIIYKLSFSKLIQEKVEKYSNTEENLLSEKLEEDWYCYEVKRMYYFKKIQCFMPFFQPNFDI